MLSAARAVGDLVGARGLISMVRSPRRLLADRAYDAKSLRDELAARRIKAVIPPNPTRKHPHRYDKTAYKGRNVIERMFCRLKDFRRIHLPVCNPPRRRDYLVDQLSPNPSLNARPTSIVSGSSR